MLLPRLAHSRLGEACPGRWRAFGYTNPRYGPPAASAGMGLRVGVVQVLEFDADGVGVGVVEVVEDGQGVLPGVAGGLGVAGGVVGVAEVDECVPATL